MELHGGRVDERHAFALWFEIFNLYDLFQQFLDRSTDFQAEFGRRQTEKYFLKSPSE
jgi:hypothetical protein